jgi:2-haloacid dehalogenase
MFEARSNRFIPAAEFVHTHLNVGQRNPSMKLKAVALDVIETLFDIQPLEKKLKAAGLPSGLLKLWFARVLRDAFALEVVGEYKRFAEIGSATLEVLMRENGVEPEKSTIEEIIQSLAELPAHPDVEPALEKLRAADLRVVALTNGSAETTKKMFRNAKLDEFVERYISIDEVKHWKPAREIYLHAAKTLDVDPTEIALITAHDWDIQGAKRAGFVTAFIQRKANFSEAMGKPDVRAATLEEFVGSFV